MKSISRRGFLAASAVAGLGASVKSAASPSDRIRVAVIGLNNRGPQVAESLFKTGRFEIVTLCDCDTAMFDKGMKNLVKAGFDGKPEFEQDFRRVLDDKGVDAIVNATPDHWHAMLMTMALEAGKHVYQEKPASFNIQDGKAMVAAQEKYPKQVVLVGTQQRSGRHFAEAREFVKSGALGKIGFCRAWITHKRPVIAPIPDSEPPKTFDYDMWLGPAPKRPHNKNRCHYNWRFIKDYGTGEMGNWGAHWLDVILWYLDLDYPKSATGLGGMHVVRDAKEWPDTQTVVYEYPELSVLWELRLWTKTKIYDKDSAAEIQGDKGTLVVSRKNWTFYPAEGPPQEQEGSEMELAHARHFADCIRGDAKPIASIKDGHKSSVLCHIGNIVGSLNRKVTFDSPTQTFGNDQEANAMAGRPYRSPWALRV